MTIGSLAVMRLRLRVSVAAQHRLAVRLVQFAGAMLGADATGGLKLLGGVLTMDHGLDFDLGENAEMIRESTRRFASDKIAPIAAEIDAKDKFPRELWPQMGELGLHGITVEEE